MSQHQKTRVAPSQIAKDTFVIHDHTGEGEAPVLVAINSMVIRSREPVVVDTGFAANRDQFLADVFSLVDPEDIRWLFISHDDVDHTGNITALMEAAPNATLVNTWFMQERMGATLEVPPHRWRWVRDGESIDVGDRTLYAVRPPIYDSPTTRGLYDPTTAVYWAADSFATPMLAPSTSVEQLDPAFWEDGMAMFNQYVSPWLHLVEDAKFQATIDRIERLGVTTIAGCHTPTIGASHVAAAIRHTRTTPAKVVPEEPGQEVLDAIVTSMMAGTPN